LRAASQKTLGSFASQNLDFLCELGRRWRLSVATGDVAETVFLLQRLSNIIPTKYKSFDALEQLHYTLCGLITATS